MRVPRERVWQRRLSPFRGVALNHSRGTKPSVSADTSGCHSSGKGAASGIWQVEARGAAQHPPSSRTAPTAKKLNPPTSAVLRLRNPDSKCG